MSDELTIRFGDTDPVGVRPLLATISDTMKLLTAIDSEMSRERKPSLTWIVAEVKMSSPIRMTIRGLAKEGRQEIFPVRPMIDGLIAINQEAVRPRFFSDEAMDAAHALAGRHVELSYNGTRFIPTLHIAANVETILGRVSGYVADASIDGNLDVIWAHGDNPQFLVFDPINDRGVKCKFMEHDLATVVSLLKHRVRVYGAARFNKYDEMTSIDVEDFHRLPELHEVPDIEELHSARINITNGESAADYVRRLRDDNED